MSRSDERSTLQLQPPERVSLELLLEFMPSIGHERARRDSILHLLIVVGPPMILKPIADVDLNILCIYAGDKWMIFVFLSYIISKNTPEISLHKLA
ncbi:hypothetical protein DM860_007767 [Cuscuta australis]|uniref:Uncharacterized protein n=1 Tax=Cuscuta australis TaxID=267555 RepID=A0A328E0X9_9ASTE|nr:hypothetical protein DM860_007767 [Cuscuta australis]